MAKVFKAIDMILDFFETKVCSVLFAVTCIVLFVQVVFRALGLGVSWCEEVARYLNVWVIYLAAAKATKYSKHMSVDILSLLLKGKGSILLQLFAAVVSLVFFIVLAKYGTQVLMGMSIRPQFSAANRINMLIPYAAPTAGAYLMLLRQLGVIYGYILQLFDKNPPAEGADDMEVID